MGREEIPREIFAYFRTTLGNFKIPVIEVRKNNLYKINFILITD